MVCKEASTNSKRISAVLPTWTHLKVAELYPLQINMEATKGRCIEDSSLVRGHPPLPSDWRCLCSYGHVIGTRKCQVQASYRVPGVSPRPSDFIVRALSFFKQFRSMGPCWGGGF